MNTVQLTSEPGRYPVVVTRIAQAQWQAVEDDQVVGHGDVSHRPDGRAFISIDAWHDAVFDQLARAMPADLPTPLHTVVDESDLDSVSSWQRAGFSTYRREWSYLVPTDPQVTGLDPARPPAGVTIVPAGEAQEGPLRTLAAAIREEVEATVGWESMPAEVLPRPAGVTVVDPTKYAVAVESGQYVGLLRLATATRQPRIGLIAVRAGRHRRGIARALLAHVLGSLHGAGVALATAEVDEANGAARELFEGIGARRVSSSLELVRR